MRTNNVRNKTPRASSWKTLINASPAKATMSFPVKKNKRREII
jgi:hypothetical protein